MKSRRNIPLLLFLSVLTTTVLPLVAAMYFLDMTLETSLNLGFNNQITDALEISKENLKTLKTTDPANETKYREQFEGIEKLSFVYSKPELVKTGLLESLRLYFGLGLILAVLISVAVAALLSRRISKSYKTTFDDLTRHREKVRYLEEISSWQELAKMLAHEIKNPLTPIEMLITSLESSFAKKSPDEFRDHLAKTQVMIREEVGHLKTIVNKFSEFAKVPEVRPVSEDLNKLLDENARSLTNSFDRATIRVVKRPSGVSESIRAKLDGPLFRQVLFNIVKNGIEANPGRNTKFDIALESEADSVSIFIANDGVPVPPVLAERIFDPYVSSKSDKENMGLGLAIVKKIMIEHGGDIFYEERAGHPVFKLTFQRET